MSGVVHVATLLVSLHAVLCRLPVCHRYSVMTESCWDMDPDKRATFSELKCTLDSLLPESQESPLVDLDSELQQQARGERQWG